MHGAQTGYVMPSRIRYDTQRHPATSCRYLVQIEVVAFHVLVVMRCLFKRQLFSSLLVYTILVEGLLTGLLVRCILWVF